MLRSLAASSHVNNVLNLSLKMNAVSRDQATTTVNCRSQQCKEHTQDLQGAKAAADQLAANLKQVLVQIQHDLPYVTMLPNTS